jgi:glycosyltransferase involved in cell wall biosynthesis
MATGTFPVVTDIPANRPWVEDGVNGLLFPPGDDTALAECLGRAFGDPDLRARAGPINRRIVLEKADSLKGAETLLAAFETCIAGQPVR